MTIFYIPNPTISKHNNYLTKYKKCSNNEFETKVVVGQWKSVTVVALYQNCDQKQSVFIFLWGSFHFFNTSSLIWREHRSVNTVQLYSTNVI